MNTTTNFSNGQWEEFCKQSTKLIPTIVKTKTGYKAAITAHGHRDDDHLHDEDHNEWQHFKSEQEARNYLIATFGGLGL